MINEDDFGISNKEPLGLLNEAPLSFQPDGLAGLSVGIPIGMPVIIADIGIE